MCQCKPNTFEEILNTCKKVIVTEQNVFIVQYNVFILASDFCFSLWISRIGISTVSSVTLGRIDVPLIKRR